METAEQNMRDERLWASMAHVSTFAGYLIPFGNVLGPLIVYLVQKDRSAFAAEQAKESLNFQLTMMFYLVTSAILCLVLIGIPMLIAGVVFELVCVIIAAVRASRGEPYRYPMTLRLVR
jgi:uncharacterized protein